MIFLSGGKISSASRHHHLLLRETTSTVVAQRVCDIVVFVDNGIVDDGAVALAPAISELKQLTTLHLSSKLHNSAMIGCADDVTGVIVIMDYSTQTHIRHDLYCCGSACV